MGSPVGVVQPGSDIPAEGGVGKALVGVLYLGGAGHGAMAPLSGHAAGPGHD